MERAMPGATPHPAGFRAGPVTCGTGATLRVPSVTLLTSQMLPKTLRSGRSPLRSAHAVVEDRCASLARLPRALRGRHAVHGHCARRRGASPRARQRARCSLHARTWPARAVRRATLRFQGRGAAPGTGGQALAPRSQGDARLGAAPRRIRAPPIGREAMNQKPSTLVPDRDAPASRSAAWRPGRPCRAARVRPGFSTPARYPPCA